MRPSPMCLMTSAKLPAWEARRKFMTPAVRHDAASGNGFVSRMHRGVPRPCEARERAALAAPDRRHGDLIERAGLLVDLRALAESQIVLVQADSYFAEPLAVTGHRDACGLQARIDLDEGVFDIAR